MLCPGIVFGVGESDRVNVSWPTEVPGGMFQERGEILEKIQTIVGTPDVNCSAKPVGALLIGPLRCEDDASQLSGKGGGRFENRFKLLDVNLDDHNCIGDEETRCPWDIFACGSQELFTV